MIRTHSVCQECPHMAACFISTISQARKDSSEAYKHLRAVEVLHGRAPSTAPLLPISDIPIQLDHASQLLLLLPALKTLDISRLAGRSLVQHFIALILPAHITSSTLETLSLKRCEEDVSAAVALLNRCTRLTGFEAMFDEGAILNIAALFAGLHRHGSTMRILKLDTARQVVYQGQREIKHWVSAERQTCRCLAKLLYTAARSHEIKA